MKIPKNPPREIKEYFQKIDFKRGLKGYYFFAVIFLSMGIISFIAVFLPPYEEELATFKLLGWVFFSLIGAGIVKTKNRKLDERLKAFENGDIYQAKIVSVKKIFVPWKSARDVVFHFEFEVDGHPSTPLGARKLFGSFQSSNQKLIAKFPTDSKIDILFDQKSGSLFIPIECGVEIETF